MPLGHVDAANVKSLKITPGASARSAFRMGIVAASVAAFAVIGLLYWFGALTLPLAVFTLLILYPVYLVFVASALSVWLGYSKDVTDLRPVYRPKNEGNEKIP
jgi:hypothetical protein